MNSEPSNQISPPARFAWLTFYAALISLLGGGWIWFSANFIWPRIEMWFSSSAAAQEWGDQARSHQRLADNAWWIIGGWTLLLLSLSLWKRAKLHDFCRMLLLIQAPLFVLGSILLSVQAFILLMAIGDAEHIEARFYKSRFHYGLLKDALRGDQESSKGLRPLTTEEISQLSKSDRDRRLMFLHGMLKDKPEAPAAKRILATIGTLRPEPNFMSRESSVLVLAANDITGLAMRSEGDVINWVTQHLGQDGWDPLPLYDISILDDRKKDRSR